MKDLVILRGLPGSGKSTLAGLLSEGGKYSTFSVDDFFTDSSTGEYRFDYSRNHLAYKECLEKTRAAMDQGADRILIHNTFTMEWEITPYFDLAKAFGYRVFVCTVEKWHNGDNTHQITEEQIRKMKEKFEVRL